MLTRSLRVNNNASLSHLLLPSSTLFTAKRTTIFSNHVSKKLEEVATQKSYEAPLWIDANTVTRSLFKKNIRARPNEAPTTITVQQNVALYNIDQLTMTAKGSEFVSSLPRGVKLPMDASNQQPFRGAVQQQLEVIAFNKKWGPWWLPAQAVKFLGFNTPRDKPFEPAAWKTITQSFNLWNFDQLESGSDIDLATVPVNFRYNCFTLGTDLGEKLRNEVLRRNLKYPIVTTSKMIELVGCSILPESIDGFVPEKSPGFNNNNNPFDHQNQYPLYNLDEFNVGAQVIMKAMGLADAQLVQDSPTFAMTGRPIMRQLILNNKTQTPNHHMTVKQIDGSDLVENLNNNNNDPSNPSSSTPQTVEELVTSQKALLKKFTTNYWIREYEARQHSNGEWRLKPDAVGARLGVSVYELRRLKELKDRAEADGTGDVTANENAELNNQYNQQQQQQQNSYYGRFQNFQNTLNPYYFDADVKERKDFLAALGTYVL